MFNLPARRYMLCPHPVCVRVFELAVYVCAACGHMRVYKCVPDHVTAVWHGMTAVDECGSI